MGNTAKKIVVVGAGAWGGWTAYHLLRMGTEVILIDAFGPGNAHSGSGGTSRIFRASYGFDLMYSQMAIQSLELLRDFEKLWQKQFYFKTGLLWLFRVAPHYAIASKTFLAKNQYPFHYLDASKAGERFPQFNFDDIWYIFHEPEAGILKAKELCQQVARQFQKEGGRLVKATVSEWTVKNGQLVSVQTTEGDSLEADAFVFACGAWNKYLFPSLLDQHIRVSRQEVFFFDLPSEQSTSYQIPQLPVWLDFDAENILHYGFPHFEEAGLKISYDRREANLDPRKVQQQPTKQILKRTQDYLRHRLPALKHSRLQDSRICHYDNSPDGHYIIDRHPDYENAVIASGSSGHGYKNGVLIGKMIAQNILEGKAFSKSFALKRLKKIKKTKTQFSH